jgi:hypothetical protein
VKSLNWLGSRHGFGKMRSSAAVVIFSFTPNYLQTVINDAGSWLSKEKDNFQALSYSTTFLYTVNSAIPLEFSISKRG